MCFEQKTTQIKDGRHIETGEPAGILALATKTPVNAPDGFYYGQNDNKLVGPFPSRGAAESHRSLELT